MPHSYEELRTAAFDVLAKRVRITYDPSQYRHLTIGVATALLERDGQTKQQHHSVFPRDATLEPEDADTFLEVFWDLFRQGIITLGLNDSNPEFPWFHLTALGEPVVAGEDAYFRSRCLWIREANREGDSEDRFRDSALPQGGVTDLPGWMRSFRYRYACCRY